MQIYTGAFHSCITLKDTFMKSRQHRTLNHSHGRNEASMFGHELRGFSFNGRTYGQHYIVKKREPSIFKLIGAVIHSSFQFLKMKFKKP